MAAAGSFCHEGIGIGWYPIHLLRVRLFKAWTNMIPWFLVSYGFAVLCLSRLLLSNCHIIHLWSKGIDENDEGSHHMRCVGGRVGWVGILPISNTSMSCPRQPIHKGCWGVLFEGVLKSSCWVNTYSGMLHDITPATLGVWWRESSHKITDKMGRKRYQRNLDLKLNYDLSGQIIGTKPPRWFHPRWWLDPRIPQAPRRWKSSEVW